MQETALLGGDVRVGALITGESLVHRFENPQQRSVLHLLPPECESCARDCQTLTAHETCVDSDEPFATEGWCSSRQS